MLPQFTVIFLLLFHYLLLKIFFEVPLNLLYLPQILNNYISQFSITHSSGRKCCKSRPRNIVLTLIIINAQYTCQHELKSQMHFFLIMVKIQIFRTMSFSRPLFKNTPFIRRWISFQMTPLLPELKMDHELFLVHHYCTDII